MDYATMYMKKEKSEKKQKSYNDFCKKYNVTKEEFEKLFNNFDGFNILIFNDVELFKYWQCDKIKLLHNDFHKKISNITKCCYDCKECRNKYFRDYYYNIIIIKKIKTSLNVMYVIIQHI